MNDNGKRQKPEIRLREAVNVLQKELISNRNEAMATRAEIAVLRTEMSGIHKALEESKLYMQSIAMSLKHIKETTVKAGEGLQTCFDNIEQSAHEIIPLIIDRLRKEDLSFNDESNESRIDAEFVDDDNSFPPWQTVEPNRCFFINVNTNDTSQKYDSSCRCCLEVNHAGDHFYKCASPNCPGYNWVATENNPHPPSTCANEQKWVLAGGNEE